MSEIARRLNQVWDAVEVVFSILKGHTERAAEAGSLRRGKVDPNDAEIVLIPKPTAWGALDTALAAGVIKKADYNGRTRWGEKHRGVEVNGVKVELFTATPDTWGYQYWLRTGPGDANQYIVSRMWASKIRAKDGAIWYADDWRQTERREWFSPTRRQVRVAEEMVFFSLIGMSCVRPQDRRIEVYEKAIESISHRWGDPTPYLMDAPAKPAPTAAVVEDQPSQLRLF